MTSSSKPVPSGVPQGSILGPILFLLYANDLSNVVKKSSVACFADDTKIFRCIDSIADATSLQSYVDNLDNWSSTSGINFKELKCKCVRVTRKTHPVIFPYNINGKELANSSDEKDLGVWITSDLTWIKHVLDGCSNANNLLGHVRRSSREISSTRTRCTLYLAVAYASQVWPLQFISLIKRTERIQRRASKFMLNLPYLCSETYHERLMMLELIPICYWHEYLDLVFFFKAINGLVHISEDVLLQMVNPTCATKSSSLNSISFRPRKCKTTTGINWFKNAHVRQIEWTAVSQK